ncbi:hypothetical protein [Variovorax boronicumulans]|uniref:hypothetical protein n=1 Tax=Variovorax boronicumulans TaxID=436515 RepID=UPI0033959FEB
MTPTVQKLKAFAAARDFEPLPDAPAHEIDEVLAAFFGAADVHATGTGPANDRYSHLIDCAFSPALRAQFFIRFDLRIFVVLPYALVGDAWQLSVEHAALQTLCAPLVKVLEEAHHVAQIAFDEAMHPLSNTMLAKGFIDNTLMAYFFESL